jgi:Ca-activated chloride channel family protein
MRFDRPEFLLLLPLAVWFWRASRHTAGGAALARYLRCGASLLLILAISGSQVRGGESALAVMFVLDRSASVAGTHAESLHRVNTLAAAMRPGDRAGLVVFGADATVERPLGSRLEISSVGTATAATGTDIAGALRLARATLGIEGARRIVLLSDGNETAGNAVAESARAASDGVPIDVIPNAAAKSVAPIEVTRVAAPQAVRVDEPFTVIVTAKGVPATRGTITVTATGGESWSERVIIGPDGLATTTFSTRSGDTGVRLYEATARADRGDDFDVAPRPAGAVVSVAGETHLLYVGATPRLVGPTLTRGGFRLDSLTAEAFPRSTAALATYDGVIVDDVAAERLDAAQVNALAAQVQQQGAGFLFLGGRDSLDAGLLADNPLGQLLPIDVRPRSGQRAPALGLVVAFDKSGSMDDRVDGVPRVEFARQAVRRVFDAVPASDAVGVIAFDSAPHEVAPLAPGHDPQAIVRGLSAVQASGATAIAPAIELASQWLRNTPAGNRRHVLLVSDGRTSAADVANLRAIVAGGDFELSVVALGADADRRLLESLANSTGGRAFFPRDIRDLPAIVAREAARVSGGRLYEKPFRPVTRSHALVAGMETAVLPELTGYVVGVTKPSAEAPLRSPLEDPILATWRLGLGRVAVYTAELHGPWSQSLRTWDGFDRLFTQTMRWVSRRVRDDALYAWFGEDDAGLRVVVEAQRRDGTLLNELDVRAVVRTPAGEASTIALSGTAPGRYEARIAASEPGAYLFAISGTRAADGFEGRIVRGLYWSADREYRKREPDLALTTRVADVSGGRILGVADQVFAPPRPRAYVDLWPWLTAAALALFLAEVLLPARWPWAFWRRPRHSPGAAPETAVA